MVLLLERNVAGSNDVELLLEFYGFQFVEFIQKLILIFLNGVGEELLLLLHQFLLFLHVLFEVVEGFY